MGGIDVTYSSAASWTKNGVFISQVAKEGLIAACNAKNEEPYRVLPGDFIFQVNEVHGNTQKMVQEMKAKPELSIHILRRKPASKKVDPPVAKAVAAAAPVAESTEVERPEAADPNAGLSEPVQALLPQLLTLDDQALSGIICVTLERRPWLRSEVLVGEDGGGKEAVQNDSAGSDTESGVPAT